MTAVRKSFSDMPGGAGDAEPVDPEVDTLAGPDMASCEKRAAMCEAVIDLTATLFNVESRALRAPNRCAQPVARVRQIAMYVCHTTLGISLTEVGQVFARDRTTVAHAAQLIEDLRDDREFDRIVEQVERIVRIAFALGGGDA